MRRMLLMFLFFLFSSALSAGIVEAKPDNVEASQEGTGTSAVVKLKWKFTAGDKLYRTFNGDQWAELPLPQPGADGTVQVSDNNGGQGFAKGSNVFYEIRDAGYEADTTKRSTATKQSHIKRINMFIDSGNPTTEYAHGNYVSNTSACQNCHVTHKAKSSAKQLLTQDSVRALCETCHTVGASGSKYVVDYGAVRNGQGELQPSAAGPITTGTEAESFGSAVPDSHPTLSKATSAHAFTGNHVSPGDSLNIDKTGALLPTRNMQCTSCHQAHPSDNNYRLLKSINSTYTTTTSATGAAVTTATVTPVVVEAYAVNDGTTEKVRYKSGSTQFCEQCHKVFHPDKGTTATFKGETFFIHPSEKAMNLHGALLTSDLPLQNADNLAEGDSPNNITLTNGKTKTSYITCITCHYSHGTPFTGEQTSNFIPGFKSTMLKRMDNSGACQECHKQ